jgi:porin
MDDRISVLFGLHDLNSEFYATESAAMFLNPSFGIGRDLSQTGVNGPSIFPYTSLALRLKIEPTEELYIQTAAFGAQSGDPAQPRGTHVRYGSNDGELLITEVGINGSKERPAKYSIGHWSYTKGAENTGMYFMVDQTLIADFTAFARYGFATQNVNESKDCLTTGLVYKGMFKSRPEDRLGLGMTRVTPTSKFRDDSEASATEIRHNETTYEVSYRIEAGHGIAIQPDYQYVQNPGFQRGAKPANVANIRLEVGF